MAKLKSWAATPTVRRTMQSNKSRDTKPELALRGLLHSKGLRYRVCVRPIPELNRTADIVFRKAKVAVEVRGCFWHGCPQHCRIGSTNSAFWKAKVSRNIERDREMDTKLRAAGWTVIVVWEHEDPDKAAATVAESVRAARSERL